MDPGRSSRVTASADDKEAQRSCASPLTTTDDVRARANDITTFRPNTAIMPTAESESFKSMKPKVAPTFNGVAYDDSKAFKAAEDAIIREQWVGAMMIRLVGEELNKCYSREGVNHLENCGHLRGKAECGCYVEDIGGLT